MSSVGFYARQLLSEADCLSTPICLDSILNKKGIHLEERYFEGFTGVLLVSEDGALIGVNISIKEETKKRFTIAHELGHFCIPGHVTKEKKAYYCSDTDLNIFGENKSREADANYFAAELLMPEDYFIKRIELKDLSKTLLNELCAEFLTSLTAISIRFVTFRTEYALIFSEDSKIKWFHKGNDFPFYLNTAPGTTIHTDSYAYDFFNGSNLPETFKTVSSNAWIDDYKMKEHHAVRELSIGSPNYNQVLSFLNIENYDNDEDDDDSYEELDGYPRFK